MVDLPPDIIEQLLAEEPPEGAASAHADRPLDFHWRVPADAAARSGWEATGDRLYDRAVRSVMAALVLAGRAGEWVSYSRRRDWYVDQKRYQGLPYSYERIVATVDELHRLGLIEEQRARPGDHRRTGLQSRMRATAKLIDAFAGVRFKHDAHEIIRLRDGNGDAVDYTDTVATHRMRRDLLALNDSLSGVRLALPGEGVVVDGDLIHVDGATVRMTEAPKLYRVFSRGSFNKGGRVYWWGQNIPSSRRADLLIDGEPVVELDYQSLHPRMLYARRGAELHFDPYAVEGYDRQLSKRALLVALNAPNVGKTIAALLRSKSKDGSAWPLNWPQTRTLVDAVVARNAPIAEDIASDVGIDLQRDDAEIALRVLKACAKVGIVCLPVHDSFIVQRRHEAVLQAIMDAEFQRYADRYSKPVIEADFVAVNHCHESGIRPGIPQMGVEGAGGRFAEVVDGADPIVLPEVDARPRQTRSKVRIDFFDYRTRPSFDKAESVRRWAAVERGEAKEYVLVPGELEHLLWPMHGLRTGEVIDQMRREEDWIQFTRPCPPPRVPVDPWYAAERRRREKEMRASQERRTA